MTAATASKDRPSDAVGAAAPQRLWRGGLTFVVYLFTGGLYGIWWFFVSRQEMAEELDRKPSPGVALIEGIGQLFPMISAYVWYRTITDLNTLRAKVGAPLINVWAWVLPLALAVPFIYVLPEVLGPLTDLFNHDVRGIISAVGYAMFPAQVLVFGYMIGYWNEYWIEKYNEQATLRRLGPVDIVFLVLAALGVVGLIAALVAAA
jgi:hypothetical protein